MSERGFVPLVMSLMLNRRFALDDETTIGSQNRTKGERGNRVKGRYRMLPARRALNLFDDGRGAARLEDVGEHR